MDLEKGQRQKSVEVSSGGNWCCKTGVLKLIHTQIYEITHLSNLTKRFKFTAAFELGEKTSKQNSQLEGGRKKELTEFHVVFATEGFIKLIKILAFLCATFKIIYLQTQTDHFDGIITQTVHHLSNRSI